MYLVEMCHTIIAERWLISRIHAAWTNPLSPHYWSYCKQTETIFQNTKLRKVKTWAVISLSRLFLIFCRHALKPLLLHLAKTDRGRGAFMGCVPHTAHITVSQMVHSSRSGFSPSVHTTSGAAGPAPSTGGGLCRCNTSLRRPSTSQRWTPLAAQYLSMHKHLPKARHDLKKTFSFLRRSSVLFLVSALRRGMGALVLQVDDAVQHGKSLLLRSHLGTRTVVIHSYFAHVLAGLL